MLLATTSTFCGFAARRAGAARAPNKDPRLRLAIDYSHALGSMLSTDTNAMSLWHQASAIRSPIVFTVDCASAIAISLWGVVVGRPRCLYTGLDRFIARDSR